MKPAELPVRLESVRVSYDGRVALEIPHLEIHPGEQLVVMGPSGAGKTTLLRLLKGFVEADSGTVEILGTRLPLSGGRERNRFHRRTGLVHQQFDLVPRSSLLNNVLYGRLGSNGRGAWKRLLGWFSAQDVDTAVRVLEEVRMEHKLHQRASTLSGGEQQRVAIARALAQEPELLLADEPVSNLDPRLSWEIMELLVGAARRRNLTLVINLHQPRLMRKFDFRILGLRDGKIVWEGRADEMSPAVQEKIYGESDN